VKRTRLAFKLIRYHNGLRRRIGANPRETSSEKTVQQEANQRLLQMHRPGINEITRGLSLKTVQVIQIEFISQIKVVFRTSSSQCRCQPSQRVIQALAQDFLKARRESLYPVLTRRVHKNEFFFS
jgi:hypothetical protein